MRYSMFVITALLAVSAMRAQNLCECSLLDYSRATTFYLDTCGFAGAGPTCEDKKYAAYYPHPQMESLYSRVRSVVGWQVFTTNVDDWFSNVRPKNTWPAYMGRDTFAFEQFNTGDYLAIHDSLQAIFAEFGVSARVRIVMGPNKNSPKDRFVYNFILNKPVGALQFLSRLRSWVGSGGLPSSFSAGPSDDLNFGSPTDVDQHLNDGADGLGYTYFGRELSIVNERLTAQELYISSVQGMIVSRVTIEPGQRSIDVSSLPTGVYYVRMGNETGRFIKMD